MSKPKDRARRASPINPQEIDKLAQEVKSLQERGVIKSSVKMELRDETKRRGARQSQALAYNTLPKSLDKQSSIFDILNQDQAILS